MLKWHIIYFKIKFETIIIYRMYNFKYIFQNFVNVLKKIIYIFMYFYIL